jgi:hypothetical protein
MARSIAEIEQLILSEKGKKEELKVINTTSRFSVFGAFIFIISVLIHSLEVLFDYLKADVREELNNRIGLPKWYIEVSKSFQLGYSLNDSLLYPSIDKEAQIITKVSVSEYEKGVLLKVAKGIENIEPLTLEEQRQFLFYMSEVKPVGILLSVRSEPPAVVSVNAQIFYDASQGISEITILVNALISDYLKNLSFGGSIKENDLIEAIRNSTIKDVLLSSVLITEQNKSFTLDRHHETFSGYAVFDADSSFFDLVPGSNGE